MKGGWGRATAKEDIPMDNAEWDVGKGRNGSRNVKRIGTQEGMVKLGRNERQKAKRRD